MYFDQETWRIAVRFLNKRGSAALEIAIEHAREEHRAGNVVHRTIWITIARALRELHRVPRSDETIN
jgi:hypothetical protein